MSRANYILLVVFSSLLSQSTTAQDWTFFDALSSPLASQSVTMTVEQDGIYMAGVYSGSVSIPPYSVNNTTANAIALAKYDYAGHIQSLKTYCSGNILNESVNYAKGKWGEDYFAFVFRDSVVAGDTVLYSYGGKDVAICQVVNDTVRWAKHFGSAWEDNFNFNNDILQVDTSGDILLCGNYADTAYFDTITVNINTWGTYPFFLKIDTSGAIMWFKELAGAQVKGSPVSISISEENDYYIYSYISTPAWGRFDDTDTSNKVLLNYWNACACLVKYDAQGNFQWVFHLGGTSIVNNSQTPVSVSVSGSEVYICGTHNIGAGQIVLKGGLSFSAGTDNDYYFIKVDSTGEALWARESSSFNNEYSHDVTVNKKGEVFVLGDYTIQAMADTSKITSNGGTDILLSCYDTAGNHKWLKSIGGTSFDYDHKLLIDSTDNLLLLGRTSSTPAFFDNDVFTANFNNHHFIARMSPYAVSTENVISDNRLLVYPNPTNGLLYLNLPKNMYTEVSLYNSASQQLLHRVIENNKTKLVLDCNGIISGVYFLKFSNKVESFYKKILLD